LGIEHVFPALPLVDRYELERLRRSVALLPPGHSAGAVTRPDGHRELDGLDISFGESPASTAGRLSRWLPTPGSCSVPGDPLGDEEIPDFWKGVERLTHQPPDLQES
jgi:hypothetical protein